MADNFEIKFKLDDGGLNQTIKNLTNALKTFDKNILSTQKSTKKLSDAQNHLNKSNKMLNGLLDAELPKRKQTNSALEKDVRTRYKQRKALLDYAKELNNVHQTELDLKRLAEKEAAEKQRIKDMKQRTAVNAALNKQREKSLALAKKEQLAEKQLAQSQKLIRIQIQQMTAAVKQSGVTFKKLGINLNTVKLALQGNTKALGQMSKAMSLAGVKANTLNKGMLNITNSGRLLDNSFATIRSKLLLVSFAFGLVTNAIVRQVRMFAEQEDSVIKMARVFGVDAANSLDKFSSAMQEVSIFGDEAINSVIATMGAFGANEQQAKDLTKATLDLASGLGLDLNSAGLLISKSFGSSTNALARYGIEVDSSLKGQERMAAITEGVKEKFGELAEVMAMTTSGQLAQASNAFGDLQERLGQALAPTVLLVAKALKFFSNIIPLGLLKAFVSATLGLATGYGAYRLVLSATTKGQLLHNIGLGAAKVVTLAYTVATQGLTAATLKLNKANKKNVILQLTSLFIGATTAILGMANATSGLTTKEKELQQRLEFLAKERGLDIALDGDKLKSILENTDAIQKEIDILEAKRDLDGFMLDLKLMEIDLGRQLDPLEKERLQTLFNLRTEIETQQQLKKDELELQKQQAAAEEKAKQSLEDNIKNLNQQVETLKAKIMLDGTALQIRLAEIQAGRKLTEQEETLLKTLGTLQVVYDAMNDTKKDSTKTTEKEKTIQEILAESYGQTKEAQLALLDAQIAQGEALFESGELTDEQIAGLDLLIGRYNKLETSQEDAAASAEKERKARLKQVDTIGMISDSFAGLGKAIGMSEKEVMYFQAISAVANAYSAASDVMADKTIQPTALRVAAAASMYVKAYAQVRGIHEQIQKAGGSGSGSSGGVYGSFEQGGYVGGRRHSQGGTLIEAERGEFVMSRNAVESIGLEALNQMNQGGGGANINVNVSGNVMTQDFVEGELAESIKEAVRRGSDFGIG